MYWILILMLSGSGKAITQVPGYTTQHECVEAGEVFKTFNTSVFEALLTYYVCIPAPRTKGE